MQHDLNDYNHVIRNTQNLLKKQKTIDYQMHEQSLQPPNSFLVESKNHQALSDRQNDSPSRHKYTPSGRLEEAQRSIRFKVDSNTER